MLAAAPITWGVCELPGWGVELPYTQVLDEIVAAGYRGTELGPLGYLPAEPDQLRRELERRDLALVGAFCPVSLFDEARAESSLQQATHLAHLLSELRCQFLVAADAGDARRRALAGRVGEQDALDALAWTRFGENLGRLADLCRPLGVEVVFHPHAGTYVESPFEIDALMDATPVDLVGLCLDTGHAAYGGADPVNLARRYAGRIRHVHAKDVRGALLNRAKQEGIDFITAVGEGIFAPLGEGIVDFPTLVATLQQAGYKGWYVLEQDIRLGPPWPEQDPLENARRSAAYLRQLLGL